MTNVDYHKVPGKNWRLVIDKINGQTQRKLIEWIYDCHLSLDEHLTRGSKQALPIITDDFVINDDARLVVEFRSPYEKHQDYMLYLFDQLEKLTGYRAVV